MMEHTRLDIDGRNHSGGQCIVRLDSGQRRTKSQW